MMCSVKRRTRSLTSPWRTTERKRSIADESVREAHVKGNRRQPVRMFCADDDDTINVRLTAWIVEDGTERRWAVILVYRLDICPFGGTEISDGCLVVLVHRYP